MADEIELPAQRDEDMSNPAGTNESNSSDIEHSHQHHSPEAPILEGNGHPSNAASTLSKRTASVRASAETDRSSNVDPAGSEDKATTAVRGRDSSKAKNICMLYFLFYASLSCISPFLALYIKTAGGLDPKTLGWVEAIYPITTLFAAPLWGRIADRVHSRCLYLLMLVFVLSVMTRLVIPLAVRDIHLLVPTKIVHNFFYVPVRSLMDNVVMAALLEAERHNFGRYRLWGQLGTGISSTLMVSAMNASPLGESLIFYVHAILSLPVLLCLLSFDPKEWSKKEEASDEAEGFIPAETVKADPMSFSKDGRMFVLFGQLLICGFSLGFLETFAYVHIKESYELAGAAVLLGQDMSLCRFFLSLGGIAAYWYSGRLTRWMGAEKVMLSCLLSLAVCFYLYGSIDGKRLDAVLRTSAISAEMIRGGIYAAFWSTATVYAHGISPPTMKATMLLAMECVYRGFGHTSGKIIGGRLVSQMGSTAAFMFTAKTVLSLVVLVATSVVVMERFYLYRRAAKK